jgi:hypothetical protein
MQDIPLLKKLISENKVTSIKLVHLGLVPKIFDTIIFFKNNPTFLLHLLRLLQDLTLTNDFVIELMINKKISEILEKILNCHMNSVHKDNNHLLSELFFLLANLVAGFTSHADYFVQNTNLIKLLFQIFKFKKHITTITQEMIMVVKNVIKNGSIMSIYELTKYKVVDFVTEIIYNTNDSNIIYAALQCIETLILRLSEVSENQVSFLIKDFQLVIPKLENYSLNSNDNIAGKADNILNLIKQYANIYN